MFSNQPQDQNNMFGSFVYDHVIPDNHLLKKLSRAVDFSFVEEETKEFYFTRRATRTVAGHAL